MVRDVDAINWPFKGYFFFVETVQDRIVTSLEAGLPPGIELVVDME